MCSKTSPPRLSFSHDLSEQQIQQNISCIDTLLLDSNSEFEFKINNNIFEFESSSADELFSNGMILPIHTLYEKTTTTQKHTPCVKSFYTKLPPLPNTPSVDKIKPMGRLHDRRPEHQETIRELLDVSFNGNNKKSHSKSFWGFSRSKSLNCDTKKNLTFSLPLLSRSNSTGSVLNPKRMGSNSNYKQPSKSSSSSSSYSCFSSMNFYPLQKSTSGKYYGGNSYGNGLRVSPVLNVPTPCVTKGGVNFFGFGSFSSVGKVKKKSKK